MRHVFTSASLLLLLSNACALEPDEALPLGTAAQEVAGGSDCKGICCYPGCNLQTTQMVAHLSSMNSLMANSLAAGPNTDALNTNATGGLEQTYDGRNVLRHLIGCALPENERIFWEDGQVLYEWFGLHNIASGWRNGSILNVPLRDQLAYCMLSYINDNDTSLSIEVDNEIWGPGASGDYMLQGGAFMGGVIGLGPQDSTEHFFSCYSLPKDLKDALGDSDEDSRDCPYANTNCGVQSLGHCGEVCATKGGLYSEWGDCTTPDEQILHPAWVNLKAGATVHTVDCIANNQDCVAQSSNKLIARAMLTKATDSAQFTCDNGDKCAFYVEGYGDATIVARNNANMAVTCSQLNTSDACDVTCKDTLNGVSKTQCHITLPRASVAGQIECRNEASCRLTCMDGANHPDCEFDVCGDPAGERSCLGYPNSKFCGECPGTCETVSWSASGLDITFQHACWNTDADPDLVCQCDPGCAARDDCCENKFAICGAD